MAIDTAALSQKISVFVTSTSHVQGAALVTPEGLPIAATLPVGLEETRAAAMAAAMMTIGDRIGTELQRGPMQHILLEGTEGYSILTLCGPEALLLILASREVKQGILMLEIRRLVTDITNIIC